MFADILKQPLPSKVKKSESFMEGGLDDLDLNLDDDLEAAMNAGEEDEVEDLAGATDVSLTPEESEEADKVISMAATPIILKDVLGENELEKFAESEDFTVACNEGFLTEGVLSTENGFGTLVTEGKLYNKTKVQFSMKDRLAQLFEISVLGCARAKNDPDYIKLVKVQKARRVLKARLRQKYRNPAMQKAKMYLQRLKKSKSNVLANVAKKILK